MFPIADNNPHDHFPVFTWALIAACVGAFVYQVTLSEGELITLFYAYGMVPAELLNGAAAPAGKGAAIPTISVDGPPELITVFSSMFLHGDFLHLAGNMLFLWIFGDNIEVALGRFKFLIFYFACGVAAAMAQALSAPGSAVPMIGASGAISGLLGGYLLLFPRANVRILFVLLPWVRIMIPAVVVLGLYFAMQVYFVMNTQPEVEGGVAFWAHIGGFVAGMALVPFMKRREVRLFQRGHHHGPWSRS